MIKLKTKRFEVGNIVTVLDGSQAARLDKYEVYSPIGVNKDVMYEVIQNRGPHYNVDEGYAFHDIVIQNVETKAIYLHTSAFVQFASKIDREIFNIDVQIKELEERKRDILAESGRL